MNLHPVIVHFPIALLSLYSVLELVRIRKLAASSEWRTVKTILVITGECTAVAAALFGKLIARDFAANRTAAALIETHEHAAIIAIALYALPAAAYGFLLLDRWGYRISAAVAASNVYLGRWFSLAGAGAALLALIVTGALGGAIVYGPDVDPIVHFVYNILIGR